MLTVWSLFQSAWGHMLWPRHVRVESDVPVFDVPSRFGTAFRPLSLYVKSSEAEPGVILITRDTSYQDDPKMPLNGPVLEYLRSTRSIREVSVEEWRISEGTATSIGSFFGNQTNFSCIIRDGELKVGLLGKGVQRYATAGTHALGVHHSPKRNVVGVLSANGPERPSEDVLPMFSSIGGGYYGQHFVEFFRVPTMEPIGRPVRLPFTTAGGLSWSPVWSADGRYLVYTTSDGTKMCVLHVDIDPKPKRKREPNRKESDE